MTQQLATEVETALSRELDVALVVEPDGGRLMVSGMVETERMRDAALEIATAAANGRSIEDNITVAGAMPEQAGDVRMSPSGPGGFTGAIPGLEEDEALEAGDFSDQSTLSAPRSAAGPSSAFTGDEVSEGDETYVPPTDPVGTNTEVIGGFQRTSMDSVEVEPSTLDDLPGDEALRDAILRELREDAATTDLRVDVEVERGIARLSGKVPFLVDAENAEAVTDRVPGVVEIIEELEVEE